MPDMLNPDLTASWEKGLDMVAKKEIEPGIFMEKLEKYIRGKFQKMVVKYWKKFVKITAKLKKSWEILRKQNFARPLQRERASKISLDSLRIWNAIKYKECEL